MSVCKSIVPAAVFGQVEAEWRQALLTGHWARLVHPRHNDAIADVLDAVLQLMCPHCHLAVDWFCLLLHFHQLPV